MRTGYLGNVDRGVEGWLALEAQGVQGGQDLANVGGQRHADLGGAGRGEQRDGVLWV